MAEFALSLTPEQFSIELTEFGSSDKGKGSILVIPDSPSSLTDPQHHAQFLSKELHLCYLRSPLPPESRLRRFVLGLIDQLDALHLKRLTVVGIGAGARVAQALTVEDRGLVRRLVLIDAAAPRPPALLKRLFRMIERLVPMGLPIRGNRSEYDPRLIAHRLRAPMLILLSPQSSYLMRAQAGFFTTRAPNSRKRDLKQPLLTDSGALGMEVSKLLREFMDVPAKRSQKHTGKES